MPQIYDEEVEIDGISETSEVEGSSRTILVNLPEEIKEESCAAVS